MAAEETFGKSDGDDEFFSRGKEHKHVRIVGNRSNRVSDLPPKRFEHYELVTSEDGRPVELGRGAMGVSYKAFDVDLRCPVTLKVIG